MLELTKDIFNFSGNVIFGNQQILTSIHKLVQTDQQILSMSQLILTVSDPTWPKVF